MRYLPPLLLFTTVLSLTHTYGADPTESWEAVGSTQKAQEDPISLHNSVAMDPNAEPQDRLKSAQQLPSEKAIQAFRAIIDSLNKSRALIVDAKLSYLIEAEIGLYNAGSIKTTLLLLNEHVSDLIDYCETQSTTYVNWHVVISAAEILVKANKIDKSNALFLFDLAIKNSQGTSLSEATLHTAETAERLDLLNACKQYLKEFARITDNKELKQRATALYGRAFPEEATFSKALKKGIAFCSAENKEQGLSILKEQFKWFLTQPKERWKELYVDTYSMITAVEILFNANKFDIDSDAAFLRWAVDHTYDSSTKEKTILHAAETAERLGKAAVAQNILEYKYFLIYGKGSTKKFKDRVQALEAKLPPQ